VADLFSDVTVTAFSFFGEAISGKSSSAQPRRSRCFDSQCTNGVIYSQDAPERRAVLQVVGKRVDFSLANGWNGRLPQTQIIAIGAPAGIDRQML
jgi:hypothetical protein